MRTSYYLIITLTIFLSKTLNSQSLDGIYKSGTELISISGDSVNYILNSGGCVNTTFNGSGVFQIVKNNFFIKPNIKTNHIPNQFESIPSFNKDSMEIYVKCEDSVPMIISFSKRIRRNFLTRNEVTLSMEINTNKIIKIPRQIINESDMISISYIGFKEVIIKLDSLLSMDYKVTIYRYDENDFHNEFVTNYGKGFKIKYKTNGFCLKYLSFKNHKDRLIWHRFIKEK